jgi:hypothetical protein
MIDLDLNGFETLVVHTAHVLQPREIALRGRFPQSSQWLPFSSDSERTHLITSPASDCHVARVASVCSARWLWSHRRCIRIEQGVLSAGPWWTRLGAGRNPLHKRCGCNVRRMFLSALPMSLRLVVKSSQRSPFLIEVDPSMTVSDIKDRIRGVAGVARETQRIMLWGHILPDSLKISALRLPDMGSIYFCGRWARGPAGGPAGDRYRPLPTERPFRSPRRRLPGTAGGCRATVCL